MGLTTWKGARLRKGDVTIAKNYQNHEEIGDLNRIVTMFLDFSEDQAKRRKQMTMAAWIGQTARFLAFNERNVLGDAGRMSHQRMETIVQERFESFAAARHETEVSQADAEHFEE